MTRESARNGARRRRPGRIEGSEEAGPGVPGVGGVGGGAAFKLKFPGLSRPENRRNSIRENKLASG